MMFKEEGVEPSPPKYERPLNDLAYLNEGQLRALKAEIEDLLPDTGSMNLHRELADQFAAVKKYQRDVLDDEDVEPNKVASVMNAVTSTLGHLIKMQESLERAETFKKMELCLIEAVGLLPEEARLKFFQDYEVLAGSKGLL